MIINPIIPIWLMAIICLGLIAIRIKDKWGLVLQIGVCILLFAINLRPMITSGTVQVESANVDVIFVVDNTLSMRALDYTNNNGTITRLEGLLSDCSSLTEELSGSRFALISFDNDPKILAPLTKDSQIVINGVKSLNTLDEYYATGSTLNSPKDYLEKVLKSSKESEIPRKTVVFFMSDGENTSDEELESYADLKSYVDDGCVIGYGTTEGGTMSITDDYTGKEEYVMDSSTGQPAVSKLDETNLKAIAADLGIDYVHSDTSMDLSKKLDSIKSSATYEKEDTSVEGSKDIYFVFLIPLLVFLVVEWMYFERKKGRA